MTQAPKTVPAPKPDLRAMDMEELSALIRGMGEPAYRAGQIFEWLHAKRVRDLTEMTNIPKKLRERLTEETGLTTLDTARLQESALDGTRKYLFSLPDGKLVESVLMRYRYGDSVCVSSQVGCAMGCRFCASTLRGVERDLTAAEMLEQVYRIADFTRVSHVVVMGSGEPFENYDEVLRFLRMISCDKGYCIGQRNLTVSTCGIVPGIKRFAEEGLQVNLAVSLHAPDQETRERLMPVARRFHIGELMEACRYYQDRTGRQLTFEYAMAEGINDLPQAPEKLAALLRGLDCVVNLIAVNPVTEREIRASDRTHVLKFQKSLEKKGIRVTIRREIGRDIDASCGQLRNRTLREADAGGDR